MNTTRKHGPPRPSDERLAALASPLRLELVGQFTDPGPLSISDLAARTGRPATSLYHHVRILEEAGILLPAGTRPKGKRFETVYRLAENSMELGVETDDAAAVAQACKAMATSLRMAERDFRAAFARDDLCAEGSGRNILSLRVHMRASPDVLAELNGHLESIRKLMLTHAEADDATGPDDQFLSLTLALAPLRGRRLDPDTHDPGDPS